MRAYRIINAPRGERWHRTQDEARKAARPLGLTFKAEDIPTDARGLVGWLNDRDKKLEEADRNHAGKMVDGLIAAAPPPPEPEPAKPSVALQSLQMDEAFDALPLARQLHFAAIAMENARASIKQ